MQISRTIFIALHFALFVLCQPRQGSAQQEAAPQKAEPSSLIEYYNTADKQTMDADTQKMAERLKGMFNKAQIEQTENELDFSQYYTNFKNLILYLNKLSAYTDYEENITFGRDREIYETLPIEGKMPEDKKGIIDEKYNRLEAIAKEEILTYQDMIETAFDACEVYTDELFWGEKFFQNPQFKETMEEYFRSDVFKTYEGQKRPFLIKSYPEYVSRVDYLVSLWKAPPPRPDSPIIAPKIIEKL